MALKKDKLFHMRKKNQLSGYSEGLSSDVLDKMVKSAKARSAKKTGNDFSVLKLFGLLYGVVIIFLITALFMVIGKKDTPLVPMTQAEMLALEREHAPEVVEKNPLSMPETDVLSEDEAAIIEELRGKTVVAIENLEQAQEAESPSPDSSSATQQSLSPPPVVSETLPSISELPAVKNTQEDREGQNARPAWKQYAVAPVVSTLPKLAIVIDDLGLSLEASERFARIQGPLTLAYLPYANSLRYQTKLVRSAGHELLVHLPMEPKSRVADPGPNALLSDLDARELHRRILWNLSRFEGFVGINNHMGSAFTENSVGMLAVLDTLRMRQLVFLDSITSPKSVGISTARKLGVPYASRDIFLDNDRDYDKIRRQLDKAIKIAERRGQSNCDWSPVQGNHGCAGRLDCRDRPYGYPNTIIPIDS